jgi:ABC-type branched-subunit amino acid transport system substrate-binding protein
VDLGTPRRALRWGAGVAVAALLAGCSAAGSSSSSANSVTAKGSTLVIYLSEPASADPVQKQVLAGEQSACSHLAGSIPGTSRSVKCDTVQLGTLSANARDAIQNESSIAYIGEIQPGDSEQTLGINNAQDLLQVSPTDTAAELTQSVAAVPGSPGVFYEAAGTYGHTFARIVPTTEQEAQAVLAEMKTLGVRNLYVTGDTSDYGKVLQAAVRADASAHGITVNSSQTAVDAIFYGGDSPAQAEHYAAGASSTATATKLFLPSGLAGLNFASGPWSRFRAVYVSEPVPGAGASPRLASPQEAFGYAAVQAVIHALHEAGSSVTDRAIVVKDFHKLSDLPTAVGSLSINAQGDSSLGAASFGFATVRGGRLVMLRSKSG